MTESNVRITVDPTKGLVETLTAGSASFTFMSGTSVYGVPDYAGKQLFVDSVYGNDSTGTRERKNLPYASLTRAILDAQSGDVVHVSPGYYDQPPFVAPADVSIVGMIKRRVFLYHTASSDTTYVTMTTGSTLRELTLQLVSSGHYSLTGVLFDDSTATRSYLRAVSLVVDNSTASTSGSSKVVGVAIQSSGSQVVDNVIFESTVTVRSAGSGSKRGILVDTLPCNINLQHVDILLESSGSVNAIGLEVNVVSGTVRHLSGLVSVMAGTSPTTNANISQTSGSLIVGASTLLQSSCRGRAFTPVGQASVLVFGDLGAAPANGYLRPGMAASTTTEADAQIRIHTTQILQGLSAHLGDAPGGVATCTFTVHKNGVDTLLACVVSGTATTAVDTTHAVECVAGDLISVHVQDTGAATNSLVTLQTSAW